ncbi:MAG TPA: hypothetical protein VFG29_01775 [Syntrophales bacterium]|nr:hypothetical protein [Syntrophales bacterium]
MATCVKTKRVSDNCHNIVYPVIIMTISRLEDIFEGLNEFVAEIDRQRMDVHDNNGFDIR